MLFLVKSPYVPYDPSMFEGMVETIKQVVGNSVNIGLVLMGLIIIVPIIIKVAKMFTKIN